MNIKEKIKLVPKKPGCYIYKNIVGEIIYIGKAKNLYNRVNSYFVGSKDAKTTKLVMNIIDMDYIVTNSNMEALILESNLIKEHKPKYNILLKDDKHYPYIVVTNEEYPRIIKTKSQSNISGKFFGPFPDINSVNLVIDYFNQNYQIRKCNKIPNKECIYYHIKKCNYAPCIKPELKKNYLEETNEILDVLNGKHKNIQKKIKEEMIKYADNLEFEKANEKKELLESFEYILNKQIVELDEEGRIDVVGTYEINGFISIYIINIKDKKIINQNYYLIPLYQEEVDMIVYSTLIEYYKNNKIDLMIIDDKFNDPILNVLGSNIVTPSIGHKKHLLEMANKNALDILKIKEDIINNNILKNNNSLKELSDYLEIDKLDRIEIFDNSHISGTNTVSSMAVFIDGIPCKNEYRKYKISVDKNDDYASMKEVITRRLKRIKEENLKVNMIVIDGGLGQLTIAENVFLEFKIKNIELISLVKDENHNTNKVIKAFDHEIIKLPKNSEAFKLLTHMQDEAHRFAINYHKNLRNKGMFASKFDKIQGLGPKRKQILLKEFQNIEDIKKTPVEELVKLGIPIKVAKNLKNHL